MKSIKNPDRSRTNKELAKRENKVKCAKNDGVFIKWFLKSPDLVSAGKLHKSAQTRLLSRKNDLRGASTIKKHPWGKVLLLGVVQWVVKTHSLNDISLCFREKRRIRDFFAEATESMEGFREFQFFCKVLCGKHFYGTKKASRLTGWNSFGSGEWNRTTDLQVMSNWLLRRKSRGC